MVRFVIASSHLMRRRERIPEPAEQAEPWDIVAIDAPLSSCPLRGSEESPSPSRNRLRRSCAELLEERRKARVGKKLAG
jgi:hypothetical protein